MRTLFQCIVGISCLLTQFSFGLGEGVSPKTRAPEFLSFQYSYDTREFSRFSTYALKNLQWDFQYFSITHFNGAPKSWASLDVHGFNSEQNLRKRIFSLPLSLTTQWVVVNGGNNDIVRFGLLWDLSETSGIREFFERINFRYFVNFHIVQLEQFDGFDWQIEHVYQLGILPTLLDDRVVLEGYADHSMGANGSVWITEHLLRVKLVDYVHLFSEFRHSSGVLQNKSGFGFGLRLVSSLL